ncbi:22286_t:CDS:2, partial [Rhizophagus irregularis]
MQFVTIHLQRVEKEKFFSGSDMKILQEIIREYPNYYFDEIVREMINKTGSTLWRYFKILWE